MKKDFFIYSKIIQMKIASQLNGMLFNILTGIIIKKLKIFIAFS